MSLLRRADTELYYCCAGSGVPVVLIQGVGVCGSGWRPQLEHLAGHGFECLTFDNRGMGKSMLDAGGAVSVQAMAADVLALMDAAGMAEAHVVGHSLGGLVAIHLAMTARARVRSLALLCTFANGASALKMTPRMLWLGTRSRVGTRAMRRRAFLEIVMPRAYLRTVDRAALAERLAVDFGHDLGDQPAVVGRQLAALQKYDVTPRLPLLGGVPALVVSGAEDPISRPQDAGRILGRLIPDARYEEVAGASHGLPLQMPELVNGLLVEHMRGCGATAEKVAV